MVYSLVTPGPLHPGPHWAPGPPGRSRTAPGPTTEMAEISEITEITRIPEIPEITEITGITGIAGITGITWITETTEITQITEITWVAEITKITEIPRPHDSLFFEWPSGQIGGAYGNKFFTWDLSPWRVQKNSISTKGKRHISARVSAAAFPQRENDIFPLGLADFCYFPTLPKTSPKHVQRSPQHIAHSGPERPRAAQSGPERPRAVQSGLERPGAAQSGPERPKSGPKAAPERPQSGRPNRPRAPQSEPERPRAPQSRPERPRVAQNGRESGPSVSLLTRLHESLFGQVGKLAWQTEHCKSYYYDVFFFKKKKNNRANRCGA